MSKRKANNEISKSGSKKTKNKSSIAILKQTFPNPDKSKSLFTSEDSGDEDVCEIQKKENKKIKNDDKIIDEYIESFKNQYDSKLNNYFKILNQSILDMGSFFKKV